MTAQIANNIQGIWSRGTSKQGGHAVSTAETEALLHIAMNAKHYDSDFVEAVRDELVSRPTSEVNAAQWREHVRGVSGGGGPSPYTSAGIASHIAKLQATPGSWYRTND
jgi:hypothetical protein